MKKRGSVKKVMRKRVKKIKAASKRSKIIGLAIFVVAFGAIGGMIVISSRAATGLCSTTGVIGTGTYQVNVPETAQYRLWVRMQTPDTSNTGNLNGVRVEFAGSNNQCFTVTTTASNAVNQWRWVDSDATAASTPHITASLPSGNYTAKILGLKAGVKVDKVLLLRSDNTCTPDNVRSTGREPGDNCTTPAPTASITADNTSITSGSGTTIRWNSTNATGCTASGGTGSWAGNRVSSGSFNTGNLTSNQTYSILCSNVVGAQSSTQSVTVTVTTPPPPPVPTVTFTADPTSVVTGSASTLTWSSTNATSCTGSGVSGWNGSKTTSGSQSTGNLTSNRTYDLSCTGPGGTTNRSVSVTVTAAPPPSDTTKPSVTFSLPGVTLGANDTSIVIKQQRGVTWQTLASDASGIKSTVLTVNGQSVTGSQIPIGVSANGDYEVRAVVTDNANNVTTKTLTIRVRHPDINRDNTVDSRDLTPIIIRWGRILRGESVPAAEMAMYDLNTSGSINSSDITPVLIEWGKYLRGEL